MKPITYNWRHGAHINGGVAADVAGEELSRIQEEYGYCTADLVVQESRDPEAPLHPAFTWDDERAAELYRLHEARTVIKAIEVVYEDSTASEPMLTLVKVETPTEDGELQTMSQYRPTREVVKLPDLYQQALSSARGQLAASASVLERLERVAAEQQRPELRTVQRVRRQMGQLVESLG